MKIRLSLFAILVSVTLLPAQTNRLIRLAIVPKTDEVSHLADLVGVEFSKAGNIQLLERAEIDRVYHEQALSAANKDYLKLGEILGADGLLLLATDKENDKQFLTVELVAVKPGVLLLGERFGWPIERPTEWSAAVAKLVDPLTPKLRVLAKEAIPISILNLRSTIQSAASREAERQLTILAIERLSREPRLFVLERRNMQLLTTEKELKGLADSAFWDGSYLLDGTVDNQGYSQETITINARLVPPKGGAPVMIEVSGSRTNYSEVINRLADKVLASLKLGRSSEPWNAAAEAEQFYAEAQWALKWNLYPQARAAAESAWALGMRNSDSAGVLFQAYSESVPQRWLDPREVNVQAFPDAKWFPILDRALGILPQNPTEFFCGTNSSTLDRFSLAYGALFAAAGQLESYYHAAEARVGHEEQLANLREEMRAAFQAINAHPVSESSLAYHLQGTMARKSYEKLKWSEYGACFEHPEDAVPAYRELLSQDVAPAGLPRFIGWTWEDRQRVPRLMREFIRDACANTNPAVRIKGLFSALLRDPGDENGGMQRAEQALISEMWDHREVIFASPENASLVSLAVEVLQKKYADYSNPLPSQEPFADFRYRLRVDFLARAASTNLDVIQELLPNSSQSGETPEQARELVPLVIAYQQKLAKPGTVNWLVTHLRYMAAIPNTNSEAAGPIHPVEELIKAEFINWNLKRPGISPNRRTGFRGMILRNGRIWMTVIYAETNGLSSPFDRQVTYLAVDPQSGVTEEIPFPEKLGAPGLMFEVSSNALFVEAGGHLYDFKFAEKVWAEISAPMEGSTHLIWMKDRLFISRNDGLLSVNPDNKSLEVLVSSRRKPTENAVDSVWDPNTLIFARADGRLGALTKTGYFTFDPAAEHWSFRPMLPGTNGYPSFTAKYSSTASALWLLSGPQVRHYLVGFWNDNQPCQSLLMEEAPFTSSFPINEEMLKPVRWEWPREFSLEPAAVYAEDNKLWVLCPRTVPPEYGYILKKPVQFADSRDATVFYFEPEFRETISVPVKFEIGNPSMNPFVPSGFEMPRTGRRWGMEHVGNIDFWVKTTAGLVFINPRIGGHWLIPESDLQAKLEAQRQTLRKSATAQSKRANLEKP